MVAIEDDPEKTTKDTAKSSTGTGWSTLVSVGALATSLIVAFFTSSSGLPSLKTTLTITAPKTVNDVGEVIGTQVPFRWIVSQKTLWHGEIPEDRAATIYVQEEGGSGYHKAYPGQSVGASIDLPGPGVYQITIRAENEPAAQPQTIKLTVKNKAKATSTRSQ